MITIYSPEDVDARIFGQPLTNTLAADDYYFARSLYPSAWKWENRIRAAGIDPARVDAAIPKGTPNARALAGWYYDPDNARIFGRALTWQEVDYHEYVGFEQNMGFPPIVHKLKIQN